MTFDPRTAFQKYMPYLFNPALLLGEWAYHEQQVLFGKGEVGPSLVNLEH